MNDPVGALRPRARAAGIAVLLLAIGVASPLRAARYPAQPAVGSGLICVSDAGVHCFSAADRGPAWRALEGTHTLEPVIAGERLLVGSSEGLYAFDAATGERSWHRSADGLVFSPTVDGGVAYAADEQGRLVAHEVATGAVRWRRGFDGWSYPPAVIDGVLVTGGREGLVRGLDAGTGETLWRVDAGGELVYRPVAAGRYALVTTFPGKVMAVTGDGRVAWRADDGVASRSPWVADGRAYFGGLDGRLRARRVDDGTLLWHVDVGARPLAPGRSRGDRVAMVTADGAALVLDGDEGRVRVRRQLSGAALTAPVPAPDRGWLVATRAAGTIEWIRMSD